jgi:hypothetical protein
MFEILCLSLGTEANCDMFEMKGRVMWCGDNVNKYYLSMMFPIHQKVGLKDKNLTHAQTLNEGQEHHASVEEEKIN